MAIRFRFRSSVNFDSVDIEGRPSISVRDLKSKILHNKNLNFCQDFDLVLCDAATGQEYSDENGQLPSGSSVIIKRVPAGALPSNMPRGVPIGDVGIKDTEVVKTSAPLNADIDNLDDFGVDLCPIPEATISDSDLVDKKLYFTNDDTDKEVPRCFEMPEVRHVKPQASKLSEAIPRGPLCTVDDKDAFQIKSKPSVFEFIKPERVVAANPVAIQSIDLPDELKCSLCDTLFKEAVMIPCCQHSFCEKCIRLVLVEKGRCPKCLSNKYRAEDLLPNVSLRQAIEHSLQSQILIKSSDNAFGYAPDGESGIQVKEMSCAMSVQQRETELPHSPCTTGRGSNQIVVKSPKRKSSVSDKLNQTDAQKHGSTQHLNSKRGPQNFVAEFQGENEPVLEEEAESTIKEKRETWINHAGAGRNFIETGRQRKGDRACYMCGSPDHFIRDCPAASSPHPMLQRGNAMFPGAMPGYLPPYWNGTPFLQMSPFVNPYGNPFNAMVPPATFAVPSYMPPMFNSMAPYGGFTRMGGVASSVVPSAELHLGCSDYRELQGHEKRQKISNDNLKRGQYVDDDEDNSFSKRRYYTEAERLCDAKSIRDRDDSISHSKDSLTERPHGKRHHYSHFDGEPERSSSEVEDMPSSSNWHSEERHKHHSRNSKKYDSGRERDDADYYSHSHYRITGTNDLKRKGVVSNAKWEKHKHNSQSETGLQPSLFCDQKTQWKERDSSHGSKHSRHNSRTKNDELNHERWQMVSGTDEDDEEYHYYYKRKRHP